MRRLVVVALLLLALAPPAWAQRFQPTHVLSRATRASGEHSFAAVPVPLGVRGLRFTMDISEATGTLPAIACELEGSLDGGTTWMKAGSFTRAAAPKGNDRNGNLQATTGASFAGGPFWNAVDNPNRRLRGKATVGGTLRFLLTVQPL